MGRRVGMGASIEDSLAVEDSVSRHEAPKSGTELPLQCLEASRAELQAKPSAELASEAGAQPCDGPPAEPCHSNTSPRSIMQTVWARMGSQKESPTCKGHSRAADQAKTRRRRVRLWCALSVPVVGGFLLVHLGRFLVSELQYQQIFAVAPSVFGRAMAAQWDESRLLLSSESQLVVFMALQSLHQRINYESMSLLDRAVDGIWSQLLVDHHFNNFTTSDTTARWKLAYGMWLELLKVDPGGADSLFVGFDDGAQVAVHQHHYSTLRSNFDWFDAPPAINSSAFSWSDTQLAQPPGEPLVCKRELNDTVFYEPLPVSCHPAQDLTQSGFYQVQARLARANPGAPPLQSWSGIFNLSRALAVSWTTPIVFCGNYSCFQGVVAAAVLLSKVASWCEAALDRLQESTGAPSNLSTMFIVLQDSEDDLPVSNGALIAWGNSARSLDSGQIWQAEDAPDPLVRVTARELLARYGAYNSTELKGEVSANFSFPMNSDGRDCACKGPSQASVADGCFFVMTNSTALDFRSRWLLVAVMPMCSLGYIPSQAEALSQQKQFLSDTYQQLQAINGIVFALLVLLSMVMSAAVVLLVAPDLRRVSLVVRKLEALDFKRAQADFSPQLMGRRALIAEVGDLQDAFCRLSRGVQAFARFVPEAVVRNILHGNERARRLHVNQREVTAMFSNIRGFVDLSETLSQDDLVLVLTHYFTFMTQVVERNNGVVAEILGDGMLAFWNTPDDVEDHPKQACAAALEMQAALVSVNTELVALGLPPLAVRAGLHTGTVLTGNLGSETKMKFGCMGDAVNLASRLQGLCKCYDVDIVCSGSTHAGLAPDADIVTRRLDLVQVKGKSEPTWIYEVMGREDALTPRRLGRAHRYEEALAAYQAGHFAQARELAESLADECPKDAAARQLGARAAAVLGPTGEVLLSDVERAAWRGVYVMSAK